MTDTATLAASHTEMTELLLPNDTNQLGRALGGAVLHWMDVCAAVAAMRFSNRQCVTASIGGVEFEGAIQLGEVALVEGYVFRAGRTSMDLRVDVRAEDPVAGERRETASAFFTFVAVDEDGVPVEVPALTCPTEDEAALRDTAREQRRDQLEASLDRLD